jgi:pimeloyl-ACP methyl ester carboxylesterase
MDLPGYGDSDGDPPEDWLGFINQGGYAEVAATVVRQLVLRFSLDGVVLAGHCAGAITATYGAEASGDDCMGLILIEPYFHLAQEAKPSMRQKFRVWAQRNQMGGMLYVLFNLAKHVPRILGKRVLPANANVPLLNSWKRVSSRGIPILLLKAPTRGAQGDVTRIAGFDYLQHVMDTTCSASRVELRVAEEANHSFSNRAGRLAVRNVLNEWLNQYLPLRGPTGEAESASLEHNSNRHDIPALFVL